MWIRVETNVRGNLKVQRARTVLGLSTPEMVGHLVILWGELAEQHPEGQVADVPPSALEEWAGWRGEPGLFARVFLDHFVTDGVVDSWEEMQGKLIARQLADRQRKRKERSRNGRGQSVDSPRTVRGKSSANGNDNGNERTTAVVVTGADAGEPSGRGDTDSPADADDPPPVVEVTDVAEYAVLIAQAANLGVTEQWGEQPTPLRHDAPATHRAAEELIAAGVPVLLARDSIYTQCKQGAASKLPRPPRSVAYFVPGVRGDHDAARTREAQAATGAPPPLALLRPAAPPFRPARRLTIGEEMSLKLAAARHARGQE